MRIRNYDSRGASGARRTISLICRATFLAALLPAFLMPAASATAEGTSEHAGLRAYQRFLSADAADAPARQQSDEAFVTSISTGCPNVLAGLNQLPGTSKGEIGAALAFGEEAGADLALVQSADLLVPFSTLSHTLSQLPWPHQLGATISSSLRGEQRLLQLAPSNLCADAGALAANAQVTPSATEQFLATVERDASAGLGRLNEALRRHRTRQDAGVIKAINALESRLTAGDEASAMTETDKLLSALGLPSSPS
ncbi:MAG TPA: hypothetical protein VKG38_10620 [Solirubrobacteraceae bacterium]|nr:hypothetical protein [Solirubrobacteraceae bacterium]